MGKPDDGHTFEPDPMSISDYGPSCLHCGRWPEDHPNHPCYISPKELGPIKEYVPRDKYLNRNPLKDFFLPPIETKMNTELPDYIKNPTGLFDWTKPWQEIRDTFFTLSFIWLPILIAEIRLYYFVDFFEWLNARS